MTPPRLSGRRRAENGVCHRRSVYFCALGARPIDATASTPGIVAR